MLNAGDAAMSPMMTSTTREPNVMGAVPAAALSRNAKIASWVLQLGTAGILFQTLFFKFAAAEESVYIFTKLGMEPWGRIGSGIAELVASILLLVPRLTPLGAFLSLGVICGAIFSHVTKLGIVVKDDGGLLFGLALAVLVCSLAILAIRRHEVLRWVRLVKPNPGNRS